jgi:hypothetical protein
MKGVTVYTMFLVIAIFISIFFLVLLLVKFIKPPEGVTEELCKAKLKSYCLEWYAKGYLENSRPKGYDFSGCEVYGISEPGVVECKEII